MQQIQSARIRLIFRQASFPLSLWDS